MTVFDMAVCVVAMTNLAMNAHNGYNEEADKAIGMNICAAANKDNTNPRLLGAYILTENSSFDLFLDMDGVVGVDRGLYHTNSYYHGQRRNYELVNHPYYGTQIASQIIRENFNKYGATWQAIAAYWNPRKAEAGDPEAVRYYERWLGNYRRVDQVFTLAANQVAATMRKSK